MLIKLFLLILFLNILMIVKFIKVTCKYYMEFFINKNYNFKLIFYDFFFNFIIVNYN